MSTLSLSNGTTLATARTHPNQQLPNNRQQHYFDHKGRGRGRGRGRGHHFFDNCRSAPPQPDRPPLLPTPPYHPPFNFSPNCKICNQAGHIARVCPERGNFAYTTEVAMPPASTPDLVDPNWCLDSGATHHMTSSPNNLSNVQPYSGTDSIVVGNGSQLSISHIGQPTISTPAKDLSLDGVLCVAPAFLIWCPIIDTSSCLSLPNVCFLTMIVITKGTVAWIFLPAEFTSLSMLHLTSPNSHTRPKQSHYLPKCLHLHGLGQLLYNFCPLLQTRQYLLL